MQPIHVIYISLSGNTTDFINRLGDYIFHKSGQKVEALNVKELMGEEFAVDYPFVSFLPAYLEGGNGLENGYEEILTGNLRKFLAFADNYKHCYGIVGSGNRNFSKQFCLTAYQYSAVFGFPVLDKFELRGTEEDIARIAEKIITAANQFQLEVAQ